ncbi:DNA/RNA non-specific endonuclease [Streptomyces sp. MS1.AVA.1]|uniref:DNA/RNA non-specific endonuclease n=1 Tax=Streptomyces machairae TaxID=3134109 RepID=A0ABU8UF45_9ACTN
MPYTSLVSGTTTPSKGATSAEQRACMVCSIRATTTRGAGRRVRILISSTQPPGMREIEDQGHEAANGHLIPAAASGSGIDLRNLVAEYKETNTPYLNHGVEKEIRNAIKSGERLAISVIPHYGNRGSGIPTEIEYNYGTVEGGMMKHCVISQSPTGGTTRGSADCPRR